MELRSRKAASSVATTPPQRDKECYAPAESASPPPPILSPQVTASEALSMLNTQEELADTELLAIADTIVSLRAPQPPPPPPTHASYPRPQSASHIPSLAPNPIGPGETAELGSSSSESVGGSSSDETNKRIDVSEVSTVTKVKAKQVSLEVESSVDVDTTVNEWSFGHECSCTASWPKSSVCTSCIRTRKIARVERACIARRGYIFE